MRLLIGEQVNHAEEKKKKEKRKKMPMGSGCAPALGSVSFVGLKKCNC